MNLTIFDVEHGACALLTCDDGKRIMLDCGHNGLTGWRPGSYLKEQGISYLDALIVTNYDEDHVSGLVNLREYVRIGLLWRNRSVSADILTHLKSEGGMGSGIDELVNMIREYNGPGAWMPSSPGVEYQAFHLPYPEFNDENNLSFIVHLRLNGIGFLFPGDLEKKGWEMLLARDQRFRTAVTQTHVLVAPHHGRENGIYEELFTAYGCKPYWVVISDKGYQHETQETVSFYASKAQGKRFGKAFGADNRKVLTTRNDGSIGFWFANGQWGAEKVTPTAGAVSSINQGLAGAGLAAAAAGGFALLIAAMAKAAEERRQAEEYRASLGTFLPPAPPAPPPNVTGLGALGLGPDWWRSP